MPIKEQDEKVGLVSGEVTIAVTSVLKWALVEFPTINSALLASWANDIEREISLSQISDNSTLRGAVTAMSMRLRQQLVADRAERGEADDFYGYFHDNEVSSGRVSRAVFFHRLKSVLGDQDRYLLFVLLSNAGPGVMSVNIDNPTIARILRRVYECLNSATDVTERADPDSQ